MPIDTKVLAFVRPQADGQVRVREIHTDTRGHQWPFTYLTTDEATATSTMNGRDLSGQLVDRDISEVVQWVEARNNVSAFDFTNRDIDEPTAEEEVLKHFARSPGSTALLVAWWLESLGTPQWNAITGRLGWSNAAGEIGERVQTRAINMVAVEDDFNRTEAV